MNKFSDFGIQINKMLVGDKIKISKILDIEVLIVDYMIEESKFPKNKSGKCLYLQIELNNEKHVVFTGSDVLINQIQQIDKNKFPFSATIIKKGEHFEFS